MVICEILVRTEILALFFNSLKTSQRDQRAIRTLNVKYVVINPFILKQIFRLTVRYFF